MTEPLIDRDALGDLIYKAPITGSRLSCQNLADAVLTYLRTVLTPEALNHLDEYDVECVGTERLHRRIFGEDT